MGRYSLYQHQFRLPLLLPASRYAVFLPLQERGTPLLFHNSPIWLGKISYVVIEDLSGVCSSFALQSWLSCLTLPGRFSHRSFTALKGVHARRFDEGPNAIILSNESS